MSMHCTVLLYTICGWQDGLYDRGILADTGHGHGVRLVAQIHDELLFEVDAQRCDVYMIAGLHNLRQSGSMCTR